MEDASDDESEDVTHSYGGDDKMPAIIVETMIAEEMVAAMMVTIRRIR